MTGSRENGCENENETMVLLHLQVKEALLAAVKKYKVGDPMEEDTMMGPMISESAAEGVEKWIKDAVSMGGKLLIGGNRKGSFLYPTIIEDVPLEADARKEEIFGPVVLLYKYRSVGRLFVSTPDFNCMEASATWRIFWHRLVVDWWRMKIIKARVESFRPIV